MSSSPNVKVTFLEPQDRALLCTLCRDSLPCSAMRFNPWLPFKMITSVVWLSNLQIHIQQIYLHCLLQVNLNNMSTTDVAPWCYRWKPYFNIPVDCLRNAHPRPLCQNEEVGFQAEFVESKHLFSHILWCVTFPAQK